MENLLKEISEQIYNLAQPRLFDYAVLIISIVGVCISILAIFFASIVAKNQNKISLFEKRYDVYSKWSNLSTYIYMCFDDRAEDDTEDSYKFFINNFKKIYNNNDQIKLLYKLEVLKNKSNLLFKDSDCNCNVLYETLRDFFKLLNISDEVNESDNYYKDIKITIDNYIKNQDSIHEFLQKLENKLFVNESIKIISPKYNNNSL